MKRDFLSIPCEGSLLAATLDLPEGGSARAGLLVVTGGNEVRGGAWNGHARLAARLAAQGFAVLRFDRRGVGDSDGMNAGFTASATDIGAALAAFRDEVPGLARVVGWGNCDAASALMLGGGLGCDALVLSNPWTYEQDDSAEVGENDAPAPMSAAELRAHYRARLLSPAALKRLFTGGVPIGKLVRSLIGVFRKAPPPGSLAQDMATGLATFPGPVQLLVAGRDRTAQAFVAAWDKSDARISKCADASHSFVEPHAQQWLEARLIEALSA
ncbi:MAG: hydrolase 1, exosortase A system-associated [Sphingomonadales bacterium]|nr:hydrolase 1, exosortase A system-associated [Sphingomonadales bacterium]